jgi:hypothetical protein
MGCRASRRVDLCFAVLLAVGVGLMLVGLVVVPLSPHFQLDAVLTPAELADEVKREATLGVLKRASGNQWLLWTGAGGVVVFFSAVGLRAAREAETSRIRDPQGSAFPGDR